MENQPPHPPEDSFPKELGNAEDPSILDFLIKFLRNFPRSFRPRKTVTTSEPSKQPSVKDASIPAESDQSLASSGDIPTSNSLSHSDTGQGLLLSIRLPLGVIVNITREIKNKESSSKSRENGTSAGQRVRLKTPINFRAKREIKPFTVVCSLLLSITGLWLMFQSIPVPLHWVEWLMFINGLIVYIFATRVGEDAKTTLWDHLTGGRIQLGVKDWQIICLCASICLAFVAAVSAGYEPVMKHPDVSVLAWLGAIILAIIGGWKPSYLLYKPDKLTVILLFGFMIVAFALRAFNISHNPSVFTGDEASSGLSAVLFVQGKVNNIFTIGWFSFPSFFNFLQSLFIRLFGQTAEALRLLSALIGALTVGAVFLLGRKLFNLWAGIYAALFLTVFHYHNHFSRIGLNNVWDGLWFTMVLGLLWYGWEKGDRLSFLLSGLCLGLAQYFYVSSRALLLLVPLLILILALADRKSAGKRFGDIVLMALVCLVVILPLMLFFIQFPMEYNAPFHRATIFGDWMAVKAQLTGQSPLVIILDQIRLSFAGIFSVPLRGPFYEPTTPLLRPVSAFLFFLGLLLLFLKWRVKRTYILILWMGVIVLIGGLSENTPAAQRYIAITPVVALTIGFGLAELGGFLGKFRPRYSRWIFAALLTILIVFGVDELKFYYSDYAPQAVLGGDTGLVAQKLADYLQTKDSSWQVAFFGYPRMGYYTFPTLPYLAPQITGINQDNPWGSPDNPEITGTNLIFIFLPEHVDDLHAVQAAYPNGRLIEEKYKDSILYWLYEVPSS
jgi:4-amino-4-deoxy-L-arabinose transferase-like glycosyltransferase